MLKAASSSLKARRRPNTDRRSMNAKRRQIAQLREAAARRAARGGWPPAALNGKAEDKHE